ncbi:hypothetical protein WR25_09259 [Diploscapter pachys]|uniref:UDENN FNIP1/2-type domain-containing protein n=1 Tax=Diploscapter pachys TaxID=2018661 RepID=A0A2A2LZZ7_9BILA|nr:hypothetical protein WR25_09259 [Diploscapter pachys]
MSSLMRGFFSKKRKLTNDAGEAGSSAQRSRDKNRDRDKPFDWANYSNPPPSIMHEDSLRILILDNQHRVLFDSLTVVPVTEPMLPNSKRSACGLFQLLRRSPEVKSLEPLVFGVNPCNAINDTFKLHNVTLSDGDKLMVSKIFTMTKGGRPVSNDQDSRHISESHTSQTSSDSDSQYTSTVRSTEGMGTRSLTPMAMPESFIPIRGSMSARGNVEEDEPFSSSSFSPPHRLSIDTRLHLSQSISLSESNNSLLRSHSRLNSLESINNEDDSHRYIAFALLIPDVQRNFILQHIPLLESEFSRLEARMKRACLYAQTFIENVHGAFRDIAQSICQLHNANRIKNPLWLSLHDYSASQFTPSCPEKDAIARDFCDRLAETIERLETKHENYFLSRLISAVLMHHMSWVASVASVPLNDNAEWEDRANGVFLGGHRISYNAHLAQYLEVNGNIGSAQHTSKTVICGGEPALVMKLIYIMSYFIRCCTILERNIDEDSLESLAIEECIPSTYPHEYPMLANSSTSASSSNNEGSEAGPSSSSSSQPTQKENETPPSSCTSPISLQSIQSSQSASTSSGRNSQTNSHFHSLSTALSTQSPATPCDILGRSVLTGICDYYYPHFVLTGFDTAVVDPGKVKMRIYEELPNDEVQWLRVPSSLLLAHPSTSSLCEAAQPDAVIVFANVSTGQIEVCSSDNQEGVSSPCECVVSMLEQFTELYEIGTAPRFMLSLIEDCLTEILTKSRSLVELVSESRSSSPTSFVSDRVRSIVDVDHSDLRLLVNVASVYCPPVLSSVT